jgi:hypothetical protein
MTRQASIAALLLAGLLSSCGKGAVPDLTGPFASSRIRFFNFGVSAPGVNFYANNTKMTAIASTTPGVEPTTGTSYSQVAANGAYSAIAPGTYTVTGKIAATTDKDLAIATLPTTVADGKFYSFYMSGIYDATAKTVDAFVVEDPFVEPTDFSVATVRFVHAISNANPLTLFAKNTTSAVEVPVGAEVAYKGAGAFITLAAGAYDLSARYTGQTTNALTRPGVSFVGGRVYTISARGDITVAPSTACAAANRTCLDNTANR